jgi:hypothetical protein
MNEPKRIVQLQDLDVLIGSLEAPERAARWRRLGFPGGDPSTLHRERERLVASCERRWVNLYERAQRRYGRGLTSVRGRVCQGCFMQLPMSAAPAAGEALLHVCESCGRLLLWR